MVDLGGQWDSTLDASPHLDGSFTKSSLSIFFLSSLLGVCFVLAIFMNTNSQTQITTTNCKMMLRNDFPHWQDGYCSLLCMIPSHQWGKSLHSIILQFVVVIWICEFVSVKMSWAKQSAEAGLAGSLRGRQQGECFVRRPSSLCQLPLWGML